jgi:phosphoglycerol transferase
MQKLKSVSTQTPNIEIHLKVLGKTLFLYACVFALSMLAYFIVYHPTTEIMSQPWDTTSDVVAGYAQARALQGSWFGYTDTALGYPYNANYQFAFPPEYLSNLITRILVNILGNPFAAINYQFALSFGLCAMSFYWLCKKVIQNQAIAMLMGLAFSWLPYRFIRFEYGHISLAESFMIPIGLWILLRQFSWMLDRDTHVVDSKSMKSQFVLALLVGAASTYYSFFFYLLVISTLVLLIGSKNHLRAKLKKVVGSLLLAISFMFSSILNIFLTALQRVAGQEIMIQRPPEDSIFFGGSISRLLIPWGTWLPQKISDITKIQEIEWTATPLLVAIGLWILMVQVLAPNLKATRLRDSQAPVDGLRFFTLISIFFYTTTGLGTIFAFSVSPIFRCWNRFSIVISALSLLFFGLLLNRLLEKANGLRKLSAYGAILVILFSTQVLPISNSTFFSVHDKQAQSDLAGYETAAESLANETEVGCPILQFPVIRAFSSEAPNGLASTQMYWLPLLLPDRRWSFGAPAGTRAGEFWSRAMKIGITHTFIQAIESNVCGVVVDRRGYETDQEWYRVTTRWQEVAKFQARRISENYFYVSFGSEFES